MPEVPRTEFRPAFIPRARIESLVSPITVEQVGPGYVWSFRIGPGGFYWRSAGVTMGSVEEGRADAERAALAIIEPYRERIPRETECSFAEFAAIVGIQGPVDG